MFIRQHRKSCITETFDIEVYGRVHGVGFRWYAQKKAVELGIRGWVKNSWSGTVKIIAQGDNLQIQTYIDYLRIGPPMARVSDITSVRNSTTESFAGFEIRH
jgi:acylphosphatase